MNTVHEIESAIERLPREQMREVHEWLDERLDAPKRPEGYFAEDYQRMPQERVEFEEAMGRVPQSPDR